LTHGFDFECHVFGSYRNGIAGSEISTVIELVTLPRISSELAMSYVELHRLKRLPPNGTPSVTYFGHVPASNPDWDKLVIQQFSLRAGNRKERHSTLSVDDSRTLSTPKSRRKQLRKGFRLYTTYPELSCARSSQG
jgi:hypothetical protein